MVREEMERGCKGEKVSGVRCQGLFSLRMVRNEPTEY